MQKMGSKWAGGKSYRTPASPNRHGSPSFCGGWKSNGNIPIPVREERGLIPRCGQCLSFFVLCYRFVDLAHISAGTISYKYRMRNEESRGRLKVPPVLAFSMIAPEEGRCEARYHTVPMGSSLGKVTWGNFLRMLERYSSDKNK